MDNDRKSVGGSHSIKFTDDSTDVDRLTALIRQRNRRAERFLTSIRTSATAGSSGGVVHASHNHPNYVEFDSREVHDHGGNMPFPVTLGCRPSVDATGITNELAEASSIKKSISGAFQATEELQNTQSNSDQNIINDIGDSVTKTSPHSGVMQTTTSNSYDLKSTGRSTEFTMLKSTGFTMSQSLKHPNKSDERHKHGTSASISIMNRSGNNSEQRKKDQSYAYLLYPLQTLRPENNRPDNAKLDNNNIDSAINEGYQPKRLMEDLGLNKGTQKAFAGLGEYMGSVLEYARLDDARQELNDQFKEAHPELHAAGLTLDQLRRLRAIMLRVTREQNLELSTAAIGWVYFEKLLWKGCVVKDNRKLVAAVCLYLALKINESREVSISRSLQAIQRRFEVSTKSVLEEEFAIFSLLEFSLWVPPSEFMPHFNRMFQDIGVQKSYADYLGDNKFYTYKQ